jgi:hypothetical protein
VENHKTACPAKSQIWHLPDTSTVPYGYTKTNTSTVPFGYTKPNASTVPFGYTKPNASTVPFVYTERFYLSFILFIPYLFRCFVFYKPLKLLLKVFHLRTVKYF